MKPEKSTASKSTRRSSSAFGRKSSKRPPQGPQHPGEVLAQVLDDTPPSVAASWFGMSESELNAVLSGLAPFTSDMAQRAGMIFGTGAAPWLEMKAAWEAAQAEEH